MVSSLFDVTFLLHLLILFLLLAAILCHMDMYIYIYVQPLVLRLLSSFRLSMYLRFVFVTLLHFITTIVSVCFAIHSNTFFVIIIIYYYCYYFVSLWWFMLCFNWLTLWYIKVLFNIINAFVFFVVIGHLPMHLWLICCCFCFFLLLCLSAM